MPITSCAYKTTISAYMCVYIYMYITDIQNFKSVSCVCDMTRSSSLAEFSINKDHIAITFI